MVRGNTHDALVILALFALAPSATLGGETTSEAIGKRVEIADAAAGKRAFQQCAVCHVSEANAKLTIGPNLWNIIGRKVAAEQEFDYSLSLKQLNGNWDLQRLDLYLLDPKLLAPEGRMPFPGIKNAGERADLLAYLQTLRDEARALTETASAESASPDNAAGGDSAKWQGLPPGPGREDVFYRCNACHSLMIVKQQGLSREGWHESLEWMVEEQGMPPIEDEATRNRVLDYLSSKFGRK